mgnify:CR=1 FL=1
MEIGTIMKNFEIIVFAIALIFIGKLMLFELKKLTQVLQ